MKPSVTVFVLAFNQRKYIAEALESIIKQKTNFNFEILVNDDCSTDGTKEIISKYAEKYPDLIYPVFHSKNQYSTGKRNFIKRYLLPNARGKYYAICEGDDYWTDSHKLQLQYDYMEKNLETTLCFHTVNVVFENNEEPDSIFPDINNYLDFSKKTLLKNNFIQTNSVMYRAVNYENMRLDITPADWYFHLFHAQFGDIGFINKTMAVYRRHKSGIWWNSYMNPEDIWQKHGIAHLALYDEMKRMYGKVIGAEEIYYQHFFDMLTNFLNTKKHSKKLFVTAVDLYPYILYPYTLYRHEQLKNQVLETDRLIVKMQQITSDLEITESKLIKAESSLSAIRTSRVWKTRNKFAHLFGKKRV